MAQQREHITNSPGSGTLVRLAEDRACAQGTVEDAVLCFHGLKYRLVAALRSLLPSAIYVAQHMAAERNDPATVGKTVWTSLARFLTGSWSRGKDGACRHLSTCYCISTRTQMMLKNGQQAPHTHVGSQNAALPRAQALSRV
ncbi:hypothetical protein BAUCODRAFT_29223 [Baudoinia panamericana UAMH 10762]|uniref:Uncharacterized protein n=1 Tax=Baudoinia panamericana (strain UAMH 10762) TaxID=717646 RepID=M2NNN1_BAUPA|nr:uncharacterized protein BAUCODRAFT_29223 [Baudoinia panamericana UAMH 10762]EMD00846.1 hypothetical protein BAUCODRAFT_29223 [Baudoinia panamericana UAMH 10762]